MEVKYRVHGPRSGREPVEAEVRGEKIRVLAESFEVELIGDHDHGTIKLRFIGKDADVAQALFTADKAIRVTFEAE